MAEKNVKSKDNEEKKDWRIEEVDGLKRKMNGTRFVCFLIFIIDLVCIFLNLIPAFPYYPRIPLWIFSWVLVLSLIGWYVTHALKFVKQWERGVIFFLGKMKGASEKDKSKTEEDKNKKNQEEDKKKKEDRASKPGPHFILWPLSKMIFIKMWSREEDIPPQKVITNDGVEADIDILFIWKVTDALEFVQRAQNPLVMATELVWSTLRAECGKKDFIEVISASDDISDDIIDVLAEEGFIDSRVIKRKTKKKKDGVGSQEPEETEETLKTQESQKSSETGKSSNRCELGTRWGMTVQTIKVQKITPPKLLSEWMEKSAAAVKEATRIETLADADKYKREAEADATEYTQKAEARGIAEQTKLQVEAYGSDGAKILALTKVAGIMQKSDKVYFIDPQASGMPGVVAQIKEVLSSIEGKKGGKDIVPDVTK